MLSNLHTHSTFCDGKSTPEEIILTAIDKGFDSLGFSSHAGTPYSTYGLKDTTDYIAEILRLREKYRGRLQIYLGIEEDAFCPVDRNKFDYIIGSCHYLHIGERYLPIDSNTARFNECLEAIGHDAMRFAESYYSAFCEYIHRRRPDIIGHFDLLTKFDELGTSLFLENREYLRAAERYITSAAESGCIFEVNTGAISRGFRTTPYPQRELLYALKKCGAMLTITSDSHHADTLDCAFAETRALLRDVGFTEVYVMYDGGFMKDPL